MECKIWAVLTQWCSAVWMCSQITVLSSSKSARPSRFSWCLWEPWPSQLASTDLFRYKKVFGWANKRRKNLKTLKTVAKWSILTAQLNVKMYLSKSNKERSNQTIITFKIKTDLQIPLQFYLAQTRLKQQIKPQQLTKIKIILEWPNPNNITLASNRKVEEIKLWIGSNRYQAINRFKQLLIMSK